MVWLPEGEKNDAMSIRFTEFTKVTDTQTDTHTHTQTPRDDIFRACIASRGKNIEK